MEPHHSLKLFSKHAFRREFPPEDYDILSRKVVSTAAGLPLALEIIGSSLFGEGKAVWEDTLKKLKNIPDDQVQKKLRISYEALNDEQKQIFLDIACLFTGEDKGIAFYMWDDCKFYPTYGINVLVLRSLVKIGDNNELRMHDQLRDLGREIVREENFREPGERSRLWLYEEALDVLETRMGTTKVEALCLDLELEPHNHCFTNEEFRQLPNLRFLRVDYTDLTGDFKGLLSKLRWLHWHRCPGNFTPSNFHLKNLVILDLSWSKNITDEWYSWSQIKMAKKLKVLDLTGCYGLIKTPDFSTIATLERLILKLCRNLIQIDPSIGTLINLRVLDIAHSGITKLPDAIGNLEKLEEIDASSCSNLQGEIPGNIGKLSSLRILRLRCTNICSIPTSICELSRLQTLDLISCSKLQSLPELPPSLTNLQATCRSMETFPNLSNLMNLKEFFFECLNLVEIPRDIGKLSKLETLTLYKTNISTLPEEIGALSQLKQLKVQSCYNLQYILGLPSSLFKLCLDDGESVERLPDLSNLRNLSELMLVHCSKLMEIRGLGKLELLTNLDVSLCEKLAKLDGLEQLKSLRYLNISGCESLEKLPDLSNLKKLQKLVTMDCEKLIEILGLDKLKSLEQLNMDRCISLERLPDLSNLGMLKELTLCECQELAEVEGLRVLKSLERLDVSWCISLERLLDLSNLKNLKELKIRGWKNLTEIRGLEELESLELLDIAGCKLIKKLPDLSNLNKLKKLIVFRCEKLTEIRGLEELKSLILLDISGCKSIEKLPDLSNTNILMHSLDAMVWTEPLS